jgi:putative spermidine/putrescine transport system permease protein
MLEPTTNLLPLKPEREGRHHACRGEPGACSLVRNVPGKRQDTLVVAIYGGMTAAGRGAARQLNSAMSAIHTATIYTATVLVMLVVALRFVNPTQLVATG